MMPAVRDDLISRSASLRGGEVSFGMLAGDPPLGYSAYLPRSGAKRILVSVHGISEVPSDHTERFADLAERHAVAVVAPHFARPAWRDYQRLGRTGKGPRADLAIGRLVASVGRAAGLRTGRFFLFGYSGGGQFAHRYLMAHPGRVAAAAVASAGWYTFPSTRRIYPHGIRPSPALPDVGFDADTFLRVPALVTVGELDVGREPSLRQSDRVDRQQGCNRRERAERFVAAMGRAAEKRGLPSPVAFGLLPGAGHSFVENVEDGGLAEIVFGYLFEGKLPDCARAPEPATQRAGTG